MQTYANILETPCILVKTLGSIPCDVGHGTQGEPKTTKGLGRYHVEIPMRKWQLACTSNQPQEHPQAEVNQHPAAFSPQLSKVCAPKARDKGSKGYAESSHTLQGTNISQKWHFEDDFPFPQVGYVSSLEGMNHHLIAGKGTYYLELFRCYSDVQNVMLPTFAFTTLKKTTVDFSFIHT